MMETESEPVAGTAIFSMAYLLSSLKVVRENFAHVDLLQHLLLGLAVQGCPLGCGFGVKLSSFLRYCKVTNADISRQVSLIPPHGFQSALVVQIVQDMLL